MSRMEASPIPTVELRAPVCNVADRNHDHQREQGGHANELDQALAFGLETLAAA